MKLTTIIGTTIAAIGLAACDSTVTPTSRPATPSPTAAPTPSATPAPTPSATPTATPVATPTPTLGVTVTVTCSNIPLFWPPSPYPPNAIFATVTWHDVKVGDSLGLGDGPPLAPITSNPFSLTPENPGILDTGFTQGTWAWEVVGADQTTQKAHGALTIPACPPNVRVTACDHTGTASGGAISWSEPGYSTLTVTGPAPSTYHFTLAASAGQYGPLTAGAYSFTFNAYKASDGGTFTIPACAGSAAG
jgi:hypothetical protein